MNLVLIQHMPRPISPEDGRTPMFKCGTRALTCSGRTPAPLEAPVSGHAPRPLFLVHGGRTPKHYRQALFFKRFQRLFLPPLTRPFYGLLVILEPNLVVPQILLPPYRYDGFPLILPPTVVQPP